MRSITGCWMRRSGFLTRSLEPATGFSRSPNYESLPMSFVSPITNNSNTSPIPTIETRS